MYRDLTDDELAREIAGIQSQLDNWQTNSSINAELDTSRKIKRLENLTGQPIKRGNLSGIHRFRTDDGGWGYTNAPTTPDAEEVSFAPGRVQTFKDPYAEENEKLGTNPLDQINPFYLKKSKDPDAQRLLRQINLYQRGRGLRNPRIEKKLYQEYEYITGKSAPEIIETDRGDYIKAGDKIAGGHRPVPTTPYTQTREGAHDRFVRETVLQKLKNRARKESEGLKLNAYQENLQKHYLDRLGKIEDMLLSGGVVDSDGIMLQPYTPEEMNILKRQKEVINNQLQRLYRGSGISVDDRSGTDKKERNILTGDAAKKETDRLISIINNSDINIKQLLTSLRRNGQVEVEQQLKDYIRKQQTKSKSTDLKTRIFHGYDENGNMIVEDPVAGITGIYDPATDEITPIDFTQ